MDALVLRFDEIDQSYLPYVGGKGANLGELTKAGFPVPSGFCITTLAYEMFLATSDEIDGFQVELACINANGLDEIRALGQRLRQHLETLPIPKKVETAVLNAWHLRGREKAYAVRSSATAEDLPGSSFAGQQETYLNVLGAEQLLDSVRRCWASLFTDRAISYRAKKGFDHRQVLLSVVVQEMVFPEISGILFTADPVSGNRHVTTIDASFGLGEALVSGLVSADLYQVRDGLVTFKKVANKALAIYSVPEGGTVTKPIPLDKRSAQALSDERIIELAAIGRAIRTHYGTEQDVEWCFADGQFYIVQSRPITTLYPVPAFSDHHLHVLISVGHIQMMTNVMRPMAISVFRNLIPIAVEAGGRVYGDVTPLLGVRVLRDRVPRVLHRMDEQIGAALDEILNSSHTTIPHQRIAFKNMAPIAKSIVKTILSNFLWNNPIARRRYVNDFIRSSVAKCQQQVNSSTVPGRITAIKVHMKQEVLRGLFTVAPNWASAELLMGLLKRLLQRWLPTDESWQALMRSLPGNVTSEMGLEVGDLADIARQNPAIVAYLESARDEGFFQAMQNVPGSEAFHLAFTQFLQRYGMRCPGEIDISKPRWREVPTALVPAILSHLRTMEPGQHRMQHERGREEAESTAENLLREVRQRKGRVRARFLGRIIHVYRNLAGLREHHKYLLVQYLDIYRQAILEMASRLVESGQLNDSADVFYLTLEELESLEMGEWDGDVPGIISDRKKLEAYNARLTPPRVMTSEGEVIVATKRDVEALNGVLTGTPVSGGVATGTAKVVLRPEEAELALGDILIAPFTDPGWTPLFYSAKALVMEVGGVMTHGAVVAREYGIPAVVGIDDATRKIKDGDCIRVDGTRGTVEILEP